MNLAMRLEDILCTLYDYEYIDVEKFYNRGNDHYFDILNKVLTSGEMSLNDKEILQELYDELDSFIKFETNHNASIGSF